MSILLLNLFLFLKKNRFSAEIFNSYLYFSSIGTRLYIFFFGLEISNNQKYHLENPKKEHQKHET